MPNILLRTTLTFLFLFVSFRAFLFVCAIDHSDCGTTNRTTIWDVRVKGCDQLKVCELIRGNQSTLDVDFQTESNSNQTKMMIHGKIAGLFLPFGFKQKAACQSENSGLTCPLEAQNYTYHAEVDIKQIYPPNLGVDLRFKLVDVESKDKEVLFCVLIPAKLV